MTDRGKRTALLASLCLALAWGFAAGIVLYETRVFKGLEKLSLARLWCDGCFVSAVFFLGAGALAAVKRNGGFDALGYAISSLARRFRPLAAEKNQSYLDYVRRRRSVEGKGRFPVLAAVGAVMLFSSFIFLLAAQ